MALPVDGLSNRRGVRGRIDAHIVPAHCALRHGAAFVEIVIVENNAQFLSLIAGLTEDTHDREPPVGGAVLLERCC